MVQYNFIKNYISTRLRFMIHDIKINIIGTYLPRYLIIYNTLRGTYDVDTYTTDNSRNTLLLGLFS